MQQAQAFDGLAPGLQAAAGVVPRLVGMIDADAKAHGMRPRTQPRQVLRPAQQWRGAVGEHETRPQALRVLEDFEDATQDQRLSAGEGEALDAARGRRVDGAQGVLHPWRADAQVAGGGSFVAEGTAQIAGRAGMQPQLAKGGQPEARIRAGRGAHAPQSSARRSAAPRTGLRAPGR
jgi:hypothetical protein